MGPGGGVRPCGETPDLDADCFGLSDTRFLYLSEKKQEDAVGVPWSALLGEALQVDTDCVGVSDARPVFIRKKNRRSGSECPEVHPCGETQERDTDCFGISDARPVFIRKKTGACPWSDTLAAENLLFA
jgi:hypothetical protein